MKRIGKAIMKPRSGKTHLIMLGTFVGATAGLGALNASRKKKHAKAVAKEAKLKGWSRAKAHKEFQKTWKESGHGMYSPKRKKK